MDFGVMLRANTSYWNRHDSWATLSIGWSRWPGATLNSIQHRCCLRRLIILYCMRSSGKSCQKTSDQHYFGAYSVRIGPAVQRCQPGGRLIIKMSSYRYRDKIRRSRDRFIFNTVSPYLEKRSLYFETGPWLSQINALAPHRHQSICNHLVEFALSP